MPTIITGQFFACSDGFGKLGSEAALLEAWAQKWWRVRVRSRLRVRLRRGSGLPTARWTQNRTVEVLSVKFVGSGGLVQLQIPVRFFRESVGPSGARNCPETDRECWGNHRTGPEHVSPEGVHCGGARAPAVPVLPPTPPPVAPCTRHPPRASSRSVPPSAGPPSGPEPLVSVSSGSCESRRTNQYRPYP